MNEDLENKVRTLIVDVNIRKETSDYLNKIGFLIEKNFNKDLDGDEEYKKQTASLMLSFLLTMSTAFTRYAYSISSSISGIKSSSEKRKAKTVMIRDYYKSELLKIFNSKDIDDKDFDIKTFISKDILG